MFCEKCGNKLPSDAEFCNKCGTKVEVGSSKKNLKTAMDDVSEDKTPIEYGGNAVIKCGNCGYIGQGEKARTIIGQILAWLCIFIAWPITLIYFLATHKYRCPKCKSTFLGVKDEKGVFVGQKGGHNGLFIVIIVIIAIAVIAVLAAIVLVNVTQYINKGKDAAIKANLSTIMTNGAVYYNLNNNYTDFCTSDGVESPKNTISSAGGTFVGHCDASHFCACSNLVTDVGNTYCVDDTGYGKETATNCSVRCFWNQYACSD